MNESTAAVHRIVEVLLGQGLLTEEQAKRVRAAVDNGKDLQWALVQLPLVEPLHLLRAQSIVSGAASSSASDVTSVGQGSRPPVPRPAGAESSTTGTGRRSGSAAPVSADVRLDAEGVPTIELDPRQDFRRGFGGIGRPSHTGPESGTPGGGAAPPILEGIGGDTRSGLRPALSMPSQDPPSARMRALAAAGGSAPASKFFSPNAVPNPQDYVRPGGNPPVYNLGEDEGIPFVARVNGMMSSAIETGMRQIVVWRTGKMFSFALVSESGTPGTMQPMEDEDAARLLQRLKVMARIEPWKKPPQRGLFHVVHHKRHYRCLIDFEASAVEGTEDLRIYFIPVSQ